ncbi:Rpn family recombination-promoting nuclease/putative transposase [Bacteroidales bacterium SW292]|nr:Rpn family recombination-promoting nuclease/putative transposase [Bacteroidales bacterium SW292]
MRYLSPKADLTFKKVFGEHPDLIISFLNALLPFESADEEITWVEYLNPELVPNNPLGKDSIVDVRCKDRQGRQFIVEMQMMWTSAYRQRVLFNASKAYVSQLERGGDYELLQPVYSLNLVNDTFSDSEDYYHDYRIVEVAETKQVIEGLRFIFIELPKFTPKNYGDRKMQVLWLRYLTEINEKTREVPEELLENPEISKAVTQLEESAFSDAQLLGYDKFWDMVSTAKMQISSSRREALAKGRAEGLAQGLEEGRRKGLEEGREEGRKEGLEEGREKGLEEGREEGREEERLRNARAMKAKGYALEDIAEITGLPYDKIQAL